MTTSVWAVYDDDSEPALGIVPVSGRGSVPYALVHGESLVACASWALAEAEVDLVDFNVSWEQVRDGGRTLVLHDPLCPLTPAAFIATAVELANTEDVVVVGVRPVTDTLKALSVLEDGDRVGATFDRESVLQVVSPIVLPASVVATIAEAPDLSDFAGFVTALRTGQVPIRWLEAPPLSRRVVDGQEIEVLEALSSARV